ncbi:MAG: hypothetical protein ACRD8A_12530, partial [Candidatus Acidiferrales bacterium]
MPDGPRKVEIWCNGNFESTRSASVQESRARPIITKGAVMGKLEGKVAVITGGSSGMALASAKR